MKSTLQVCQHSFTWMLKKEESEDQSIRGNHAVIGRWRSHRVKFQAVNETLGSSALPGLCRHCREFSGPWSHRSRVSDRVSLSRSSKPVPNPAAIRCGTYIHRTNKVVRKLAQEGNINPSHPHLPRNLISDHSRSRRRQLKCKSKWQEEKNQVEESMRVQVCCSENCHWEDHRVVTDARSHVALAVNRVGLASSIDGRTNLHQENVECLE